MTATETNAPDEPGSTGPGVTTMYTTSWCGFCARLKRGLQAEGIDYTEIDIEAVEGAAEVVMARNGGNRTVPTGGFADGSSLTNPRVDEVRERLAHTA